VAIRAGIAVDRRAHGAGNASEGLQALEAALDGEIHQVLEDRAGVRQDAPAGGHEAVAAVAQHDATEAAVGNHEVGASADHHGGNAARARGGERGDEGLHIAGLGVEIGRPPNPEARVTGERNAHGNS